MNETASTERNDDGRTIRRLARDSRGLSTVEYIIILMLIAVAGIGLWNAFGSEVKDKITDATSAVGEL